MGIYMTISLSYLFCARGQRFLLCLTFSRCALLRHDMRVSYDMANIRNRNSDVPFCFAEIARRAAIDAKGEMLANVISPRAGFQASATAPASVISRISAARVAYWWRKEAISAPQRDVSRRGGDGASARDIHDTDYEWRSLRRHVTPARR